MHKTFHRQRRFFIDKGIFFKKWYFFFSFHIHIYLRLYSYEMSYLWNVLAMKCPSFEMSYLWNVFLLNVFLRNVPTPFSCFSWQSYFLHYYLEIFRLLRNSNFHRFRSHNLYFKNVKILSHILIIIWN